MTTKTDEPGSEPGTTQTMAPRSAVYRLPDGTEAIDVDALTSGIDQLTEGRAKAHPKLMILAFDVIQAMITGDRAATLEKLYEQETNTLPLRRVLVMRAILQCARSPYARPPAAAEAAYLRGVLARIDGEYASATLTDASLIAVLERVRADESHLASLAAQISVECGAFGQAPNPSEDLVDAYERARKSFDRAFERM